MNDKIGKLERHITEHPHDYQAVIGLLKARSDEIDRMIHDEKNRKLQKLAKVRREYNEESEQ